MKKPTEKDISLSKKQDLFILEQQLLHGKVSLDELNNILPGFLHLNDIQTIALDYVSNTIEQNFGIPKERVSEDGFGVIVDIIHPLDLQPVTNKVKSLYDKNDPYAIVSFLQRIKPIGKKDYSLLFTSTKLFGNKGQGISISIPLQDKDFAIGLGKILGDNIFLRKNYERFASLTTREREILRLIASEKTNKQIAEVLTISTNTVRTHRNNTWKKLEIKSVIEAVKYAQVFELI